MDSRLIILASLCITGLASAVAQSHPTYIIPDHRNGNTQPQAETISSAYEYQIVPNDEYAVTEHDSEPSFMDFIVNPITALSTICSKALSVISWVFAHGALVIIGMAIVIGFCALTPYCTLTIEHALSRDIRSAASYIPFLDEMESFFMNAFHKYNGMQNIAN